jgi:TolB-like protein
MFRKLIEFNLRICFYILFIAGVILTNNYNAFCDQSAVSGKIKEFTSSLIVKLENSVKPQSSLAITDFDTDKESKKFNLGFAVSEIITEEIQKSGKYLIVEKKNINKIISALELGQTGLYNSDKIVSIGKLINAQYLLVGSVSKLAGFYHVSVRVVEVATGSVVLTDSTEIDSVMLENISEKYQPPRYRLHIGSSMSWFGVDNDGNAIYSIGLSLGVHYNISGPNWMTFQTIYFFDHFYFANNYYSTETKETTYTIKHAFLFLLGYGYRYQISRNLSIQPNIFAGMLTGIYGERGYYYDGVGTEDRKDNKKWNYSGVIQPRVDFIIMENSPLSFYIGVGYFYYTKKISDDFHGLKTERTLQGVKLEGAIVVYL